MIGQKGIPALYGGIERHVEEIARRLVLRGHEVSVYCRLHYTPTGGRYHGVELVRLPSVRTKHFDTATHVALSTVHGLFRDYDLVHFHALGPSVFAWLPRLRGTPTVVTVHGLDWQREKWGPVASWFLKQCEYPAVSFPDRTIVVSQTLRQYFAEHHRRQTVTIPNGTVLPEPRPAHKIHRYGLEARRYILFVGRLVPEKGVHFLCEAFSRIDTNLTLALVGGSAGSDDYVAQIRKFEGPRVKLLDYVYGEALEELYSNAFCVVLPSTLEGLSLALLESLSYGRCVLVSDIPENLEVTQDAALTFRNRDVDDLTAQLRRLLAEPALVRHFEEKARGHIAEHYSWDRVVDATLGVYEDLVSGRRRPGEGPDPGSRDRRLEVDRPGAEEYSDRNMSSSPPPPPPLPPRRHAIRLRQLVDWRAAIIAGLAAGIVYLALQMALLASVAGSPWVAVRYMGAMLLGRAVLPPPATFDPAVLIAALAVHLPLSIAFACVIAFILHRWGLLVGVLGGAVLGLALYAINFWTFAQWFPWFLPLRGWIGFSSHIAFGAIAGLVYELLEIERFVPVEE